jgi:DNA-binding winged helix-turn-helix (wHTH) protein
MQGKLQFGVFELDCDAMELRKHGVTIRLQEQPLRVLATLVERPGEIVTREELQQHIWGKDTFVDFEQSLNKAVNRLREALNDQAGQPRYVETVPRRGYRFIAPVTELNATEPPRVPVLPNAVSDAKPTSPEPGKAPISTIAAFTTAALLVVVSISAALLWRQPERSTPAEAKRITSAASCCATLSRDGKLLAYASGIAGGVLHIWVQQTAGGEAIQVLTWILTPISRLMEPTSRLLPRGAGEAFSSYRLSPASRSCSPPREAALFSPRMVSRSCIWMVPMP